MIWAGGKLRVWPGRPAPLGAHLRSGYLTSGATLVELAEKTGLDAAALVATVP